MKADNSYAMRGMVAAFQTDDSDPGLAPSSFTLNPAGNRHLDADPIHKPQVISLGLKPWRWQA